MDPLFALPHSLSDLYEIFIYCFPCEVSSYRDLINSLNNTNFIHQFSVNLKFCWLLNKNRPWNLWLFVATQSNTRITNSAICFSPGYFNFISIKICKKPQATQSLTKWSLSKNGLGSGETLRNIAILESSLRHGWSRYVNFEFLLGMCCSLLVMARSTSPKLDKIFLLTYLPFFFLILTWGFLIAL